MTIADKLDSFFAQADRPNHSPEDVERIADAVRAGVSTWLDAATLARLNQLFKSRKRREVALDDVTRVLALHLSSIYTRNGESPVARIEGFTKAAGSPLDRCHIGIVTDLLAAVGAISVEKKHNTFKHKARTYSMSPKLKALLDSIFSAPTHMICNDRNESNER
jgi:hypothetical protein